MLFLLLKGESMFHIKRRKINVLKTPISDIQKIKDFYNNILPDNQGYYLNEIRNFTHFEFERNHNFIQWLFPNPDKSLYNINAPILSEEEAKILSLEPGIKDEIIKSFYYVCKMYGLKIVEEDNKTIITPDSNFTGYWITYNNHNYLRITRILICLKIFNLLEYAKALLACLEELYQENTKHISQTTLSYWRNTIK